MNEKAGDDRSGASAGTHEEPDPELRAKYLDYCSARLSEVFLSLTDERIYELVEEAARETRVGIGSLGFQEMMRLVTRKLREEVPLPEYRDWAEDYSQHPERYEPFLLGLWKTSRGGGEAGPSEPGQ